MSISATISTIRRTKNKRSKTTSKFLRVTVNSISTRAALSPMRTLAESEEEITTHLVIKAILSFSNERIITEASQCIIIYNQIQMPRMLRVRQLIQQMEDNMV